MTKIDTVDSNNHVHLYEHTIILPGDVSNIQYKFRVGDDLYLHDGTEDASKFDASSKPKKPYSLFPVPDGFGGMNNTFEIRWDPIYSISMREPTPEPIESPSGPGSLQVSEEEPASVEISQMPSIDQPAANDQEPHSIPGSASHAAQTLEPELVSTAPGAIDELEVEESGHTHFEKVRTVTNQRHDHEIRDALKQSRIFGSSILTSLRMPFAVERSRSVSTGPVSLP